MGVIKSICHMIRKRNPVKYARYLGAHVGEQCRFITMPNLGSEPYLIHIGNHVELSNDVQIITHDGGMWCFRNDEMYRKVRTFSEVRIMDNTFVGARTIILGGVRIGRNCVIGAGSIVTHDIPDNSVACGVPARVIKSSEEYASKLLQMTPDWDEENYSRNRKDEIIKIAKSRGQR